MDVLIHLAPLTTDLDPAPGGNVICTKYPFTLEMVRRWKTQGCFDGAWYVTVFNAATLEQVEL